MKEWAIHCGDARAVLAGMDAGSVQACVTSPPYWGLRDYGHADQIGLEQTPDQYVDQMVAVFREVRRVLRDDGTLWINLGDSYASGGMSNPSSRSTLGGGKDRGAAGYSLKRKPPHGLRAKDLCGIPWRVAFALQADGWYLRQDIIWHKPNPMPESVRDRCTKAHEYVFLLSKSQRYYFDADAIKERAAQSDRGCPREGVASGVPGAGQHRNKRSVWTVASKPYAGAHFACYPPDLIRPCVLAGAPRGGVVLDPFTGSGTTGAVAVENGRRFVGVELNEDYVPLAEQRIASALARAGIATAENLPKVSSGAHQLGLFGAEE